MAKKYMYFGTEERMTWIRAPKTSMAASHNKWGVTSNYLTGGAGQRNSSVGSMKYTLTWPMMEAEDVNEILDYTRGVYGEGLVYFLDPFSAGINALPSYWAAPRLGFRDGPSFVHGRRPTLAQTPTNNLSLPTKSAVYVLRAGDTFASVRVPVPQGYRVEFGFIGGQTDTARVRVERWNNNALVSGAAVTPLSVSSTATTNHTYVETGANAFVRVTLEGVGTLTMAGLVLRVVPPDNAMVHHKWYGGVGNSGCQFEPIVNVDQYSAPEALDLQSLSVNLIEIGAWL